MQTGLEKNYVMQFDCVVSMLQYSWITSSPIHSELLLLEREVHYWFQMQRHHAHILQQALYCFLKMILK